MEHFLLPAGTHLADDDRVPYLPAFEDYDRGPFLTYPERKKDLPFIIPSRSWTAYIVGSPWQCNDPALLGAVFQTWIFHGLICEFVGEDFRPEAFRKMVSVDGVERPFLDTSNLVALLEAWTQRARPVAEQSFKHLVECLELASHLLSATQVIPAFDSNVRLSLGSVAELLGMALQQAANHENVPIGRWGIHWDAGRGAAMVQRGWCPFETHQLNKVWLRLQTMFFLSKMRRHVEPHHHGRCSDAKCEISRLNYDSQPGANHLTRECQCDESHGEIAIEGAEFQAMLDLLRGEIVPQIHIAHEAATDTYIPSVSATTARPYLAISHVWADGLGNKQKNALKHCRLRDMYRLLQSMQELSAVSRGAGLWIDTLCCPTQQGDAKDMAIKLMRNTYEQAECVLVLDAELRQLRESSMEVTDILAYVFSSAWMRRLWTYQEGHLAKSLWIQFADGARDLNSLMTTALKQDDVAGVQSYTIRHDIYGKFMQMRKVNQQRQWLALPLQQLKTGVEHRVTTRAADEPLCIATLMNVDVKHILEGDDRRGSKADRMRRLWDLVSTTAGIPRSAIFMTGPKLDIPGYRWAPSTFMTTVAGSDFADNPPGIGVPTEHGLLVSFSGFLMAKHPVRSEWQERPFVLSLLRRETQLNVQDPLGKWYALTWPEIDDPTEGDPDLEGRLDGFLADGHHEEFGVILRFDMENDPRFIMSSPGLLVAVTGRHDGIIHVRMLRRVNFGRHPESFYRLLENQDKLAALFVQQGESYTLADLQPGGAIAHQTTNFAVMTAGFEADQAWCVD